MVKKIHKAVREDRRLKVLELADIVGFLKNAIHRILSENQDMTARGLLATDHVILNHGQVTWTTPELAPPSPNYRTTPTGGRFSSRQI
ncbi:hypothetical protein TNCV_682131 [Trichonephila clavipes]|nr:hypothetical protein TNCV_682131 [Trichonephila clavipes]